MSKGKSEAEITTETDYQLLFKIIVMEATKPTTF